MSRPFDPCSPTYPDDAIPSKLADGFAELYPAPRVPPSVDSAILNAARAHLAGSMHSNRSGGFARNRRLLRWVGAGAAAAAAVAAVVLITVRPHSPTAVPRTALAGDINGDGQVNILDAYLVARGLADKARAAPLPGAWDVNHDGVVDQKDVTWIANAAVRVGGGSAAATDSKLARSADVFELAEDLKSLDANAGRTKTALLLPELPRVTDPLNAHGACTVGPEVRASTTHGASTVGVPAQSRAPAAYEVGSPVDPKGAAAQ